MAEYEAMILGFQMAKGVGAEEVDMYNDSQLAVNQINNDIRVLDQKLVRYREYVKQLRAQFRRTGILHVPRNQNAQADALSKLAATGKLSEQIPVIVLELKQSVVETNLQVMQLDSERMDD